MISGDSREFRETWEVCYNKATNGRRAATPRWAISCYEANYSRIGFLYHPIIKRLVS